MSKFMVDFSNWQECKLPWPTEDMIKRAILKTNDEFKTWQDVSGHFIVECENMPADILVCGIKWVGVV